MRAGARAGSVGRALPPGSCSRAGRGMQGNVTVRSRSWLEGGLGGLPRGGDVHQVSQGEEAGPGKEASRMCPGESAFGSASDLWRRLWGSEGTCELRTQKVQLRKLLGSRYHLSLKKSFLHCKLVTP